MPCWLNVISHFNPLTYMIDGMRELLIGIPSVFLLLKDYTVLLVSSVVLVIVGGMLYKQVII